MDFSQWEAFVNDDKTRTFLSMEITAGGLSEIRRQINAVNDIYRLHSLPEFYQSTVLPKVGTFIRYPASEMVVIEPKGGPKKD
ncbi:hypothetical protein ACLOJK_030440 [Asimina triloba]